MLQNAHLGNVSAAFAVLQSVHFYPQQAARLTLELASAWRALAILQHAPTALIILSALKAENVNRKVHLGRAVSLEQTALVGTALTKRVAMLPHAMFMPSAL